MAVKKELHIEIDAEGNVKIKSHGFKGNECDQELKPIESALGKVVSTEKTSEFFQSSNVQTNKNRQSTK